ncbi:MAG: DUF2339 domain-containing protein [Lachnospiraceae bacterium]|nr:DUF2339 domain-containing protein [Lachnospiraceae bacterium]
MEEKNKTIKEQIEELERRQEQFYNKLNALCLEMDSIKGQLEMLKTMDSDETVSIKSESLATPEAQPEVIKEAEAVMPEVNKKEDFITEVPPYVVSEAVLSNTYANIPKAKKSVSGSKDSEVSFGKNFMGIAAAVLIFISFILFATLIIPMLSDGMKLGLMYLVSVAFVSVGLLKLESESKNTFFMSILAIGVGGIYISLFLTNTYFHLIGKLTLYVLLLLWAAFVLMLSKKQQILFTFIGGVGLFISVCFGAGLCVSEKSSSTMLILTGYFITGSLSFIIKNFRDEKEHDIISFFNCCSLIVMTISTAVIHNFSLDRLNVLDHTILIVAIILFVYLLVLTFISLTRLDNSKKTLPAFWGTLYSATSAVLLMLVIKNQITGAATILIVAVLTFIAVDHVVYKVGYTLTEAYIMPGLWQVILIITAAFGVICLPFISTQVGLMAIAIPLVIAGFLRENRMYKMVSLGFAFLTCYMQTIYWDTPKGDVGSLYVRPLNIIILMLIFAVASTFFMYNNEKKYDKIFKIALYYVLMVVISIAIDRFPDISYKETQFITFLALTGVQLIVVFSPFSRGINGEEEKEFEINSSIINIVLMYLAIDGMNSLSLSPGRKAIYVLLAIILFMLRAKKQLEADVELFNIYVGVKFTILLWSILNAFDFPAFAFSLGALILAIVLIGIGFKLKLRALRIYGLILTMICVVKFVMIDITYSNTLGHALSFFVSGLLCLAISAIYNHMEKQNRQ